MLVFYNMMMSGRFLNTVDLDGLNEALTDPVESKSTRRRR